MKVFILLLCLIFPSVLFGKCGITLQKLDKKLMSISSYSYQSQIDELKIFQKEIENYNCPKDSIYSVILFKIGGLYYAENNFQMSEKYIKNALFVILKNPKSNTRKPLSKYYYYLGLLVQLNGNLEKSIQYYRASAGYGNFYKQNEFTNLSYQYLSEYYYNFGDYQSTISYANKGLQTINQADFSSKARFYFYLSKAYYQLEDYDSSLKFNQICLENAKKEPNDTTIYPYTLMFRGIILSKNKENFSSAINELLLTENFFKSLRDSVNLSIVYTNLGYIYIEVDQKKSIEYSDLALQLSKNNIEKLRIYNNIGKSLSQSNLFLDATLNFELGLKQLNFSLSNSETLVKVSEKEYLFALLLDYSNNFLFQYKYSKTKSHLAHALQTYELADKLVDFMRQEHTGTLSKYFWRNKTRSLYENAIETCFLLKNYDKAYYFMEKSRAVMLNDKLNELGAKQKLNEADQERERDFQRKIIELNTKIEAETKATEKEKLNSQLFDMQEKQERFVKSLETKYPAYYQLKYNTQIGTLKQMQTYLKTNFKDKNATMVSYFFGDSSSYAMVISPTKAEVKQFKYDVAQNHEFVNLLATNQGIKADYARILSMGSVIYQKLIKPLNIPKGHLIISQDGVFMPFEALSSSATSAQYLLKDYAISYTYSGQFLLKKALETKFWPNQSFVGFAPVEFNNQLNSLKTSDVTLGNVAKNYWFSDTFTGNVATKANFLQQSKEHKIVQIFTHAFADSVDTEPKIYFADDALKISELNAEDQFNTQLLVLSACKTGVGKLAKGEGVLSLARGFSMLGIPATITSLWSVEDKNTYQLTELFYKYLNQGLSKDEALQKAKLEFLELHPNAGPTDWAGMVLVGQTSQLTSNTPILLVLSVIFVISIIAGGLYFGRNRRAA